MHLHEYLNYGGTEKDFIQDLLYGYPSWDHVVNIFLTILYRRKLEYEKAVNIPPHLFISADHTFKVGKNVGK